MYTDVTLKASDFSKIHNALWELQYNGGNVTEQVEVIRQALEDCYKQDMDAGQRLMDHYEKVKTMLGLTTTWSITEVDNLSNPHPYEGVETVTYKDHWGDIGTVEVPINGTSWAALYVAANDAIRDSGDEHHIFIEGFRQVGNTLVLSTGS